MRPNNVLGVLGVCAREDVHTNLFKYWIENSPQFRRSFLRSVLDWPTDTHVASVNTRMSLASVGIPDIVILGRAGRRRLLGIVEVKLDAQEGKDQTGRYSSEECVNEIYRKLGIDRSEEPKRVFLTLYPGQSPQNSAFGLANLSALLEELNTRPVSDESTASLLLRDWMEYLSDFYNGGILRDEDALADRVLVDTQLASGFLAFKEFFRPITLPDLEPRQSWRGNPRGHPYYGIQFGKEAWAPEQLPRDDSNGYDWSRFDPLKHFDIHIELQLDLSQEKSQSRIGVLVHYETNPYCSQLKRMVKEGNLRAGSLEAHMERRSSFKTFLMDILPGEFTAARNGSVNLIAHTNLPISGKSVKDARNSIAGLLSKTTLAVDQSLEIMDTRSAD